MTCEQAELRMAELLAGELAPEERAELDRHLLDCAACRADFELARAGARIEWADVPVPREVIESTLASFREPTPAVRLLRWATAAAAVFGVVTLLLTSSHAPKPVETVATARPAERPQVLATMQEAVVGALVCKDEDGRPVGELGLKSHDVSVEILDGIAKTTVEENFENHTDRRLEGTFHFPLPSDASISRLALEVNGKIEEGTCLERERAREVFESIVRKAQDPALLEWQPGGFFKCRVFPIEPRSTKRVIVAYTQALPCFQGRMTYVYPLASEKTRTHPPGEAAITVQARFSGGLTRIASPSHHLEVQRKDANEASMSFRAANYRPNNDFVVTMEPGEEEVRVVAHKTDGDDGYFACFATPKGGGERVPATYAFVLDNSASISAPRLEVAKRLVRAMMERRIEGDRFEILAHNVEVERSGEVDLRAANDFMDRLRPIGGCDVLKALHAAGDAQVIYIGKGSATFGETETAKILDAVKGRRIRTIAVGSDANGVLLERLGGMMRVNPNDDVAKRVAEIAATLGSPVLSDVKVDGGESVYEVVGVRDLFYGERLVVSGRYRGPAAKLVISGNGYRREVEVAFPAKEEGNNYVRRLWAQRKVSDLLAQGAEKKSEVTEMGVKYQIMTPYTSFLVLETEQMWKDFQLKREVQKQDTVLSREDKTRGLMEEGVVLYKQGKAAEASAKFEQAFELKPTSDQVYAFIRRAGEDVVGRMMNDPERKTQDIGRRLMELAKPPTHSFPTLAPVSKVPTEPRKGKSTEIPDQEWDGLLDKLKSQYAVTEQQKASKADEHYRLAERYFQAGDFEKSKLESQKALQLVPAHAPSKALFTENSFILGEGKATPQTTEYDKFMKEALVRHQQVFVELDNASERAKRAFNQGDYAAAEREYRKIVEFSKWMPTGVELETRRREALEMRSRTPSNQFGGLEFQIDDATGRVGPGFSAQETARLPGWSPRTGQIIETLGVSRYKRWDGSQDVFTADDPVGGLVSPQRGGGGPLTGATWYLDTENSGKAARINDFMRQLDSANTLVTKYEADNQVFVRQLEVQLAQIQELNTKVDEHRAKLAKSLNEKSLAVAEIENSRRLAERLQQDLGQLEEKYVEMARDKKHLEEKLNSIAQAGGNVNVAPKKALEAKVTAVANEIGLVVISIGKDDGVLEGDEFTAYRGGDFVAKLVIDRSDRKWSAGKVVLKKIDPRVADDVSNHIFVSSPRAVVDQASCMMPSQGLDVTAATDDGGVTLSKSATAAAGQIYTVTRAGKFVAMIRVERVAAAQVEARVLENLALGRMLPGDRAVLVTDPKAYFATLPDEVRRDLSSRLNQQAIRAKMGLKE